MKNISEEARELTLYAVNDGETYYQITLPTIENLRNKIKRGVYDELKALKAWEHVAEFAAKRYTKEICTPGYNWYSLFNVAARQQTANKLMEYYSDYLNEN